MFLPLRSPIILHSWQGELFWGSSPRYANMFGWQWSLTGVLNSCGSEIIHQGFVERCKFTLALSHHDLGKCSRCTQIWHSLLHPGSAINVRTPAFFLPFPASRLPYSHPDRADPILQTPWGGTRKHTCTYRIGLSSKFELKTYWIPIPNRNNLLGSSIYIYIWIYISIRIYIYTYMKIIYLYYRYIICTHICVYI